MDDQTPVCSSHGASCSARMFSFLAGGIAGAGIALLFAPQSGRATRERMGRKLSDAADSARDLRNRAVRRGQEIRGEARYRVEAATSALGGKPGRKDRGNGDLKDDDSLA